MLGIVLASYFSAIMSTADSCLMAASGNILTDIFGYKGEKHNIRLSQLITLIVGIVALFIALRMTSVLELMLHSYAFMVSGMFIPVLIALVVKKPDVNGALLSMIGGGSITLLLIISAYRLPFGLDPIIFGILASLIIYILVHIFNSKR